MIQKNKALPSHVSGELFPTVSSSKSAYFTDIANHIGIPRDDTKMIHIYPNSNKCVNIIMVFNIFESHSRLLGESHPAFPTFFIFNALPCNSTHYGYKAGTEHGLLFPPDVRYFPFYSTLLIHFDTLF